VTLREDWQQRFRRFRHSQRGWLLLLLSAPLPVAAVIGLAEGDLRLTGGAAGPWAMILLATLLARRDFVAESEGRKAKRGFRKRTAALVGVGTGLAAMFAARHRPEAAVLFGFGAAVATRLLYGADIRPPEPEPAAPAVPLSGDAAVLADAKARLARLDRAAAALPQPEFAAAIGRIAGLGRLIVSEAEADPADLRRVRRFLGIYLEGAERVANRYVETHRGLDRPMLEENFRTLLDELERAFAAQHAQLKESDMRALDVDIEVLQKRLREEGLQEERIPR